ncbi:MAG: multicopper oxidase domain-containing protein, partial [Candidatus Nitrosocosmicus sp.]
MYIHQLISIDDAISSRVNTTRSSYQKKGDLCNNAPNSINIRFFIVEKDNSRYQYQSLVKNKLKKDSFLLSSFVAIAVSAVLLLSNTGTTFFLVEKQAFGLENQTQSNPFPGMNFSKPIDVWSKNGILKTTLVVENKSGTIDGRHFTAMLYNGSLPGPTLHVYPGDRLELNLINNLNEPTNLHFHGFHVSPANNSDNIFLDVAPGKT